jgi:alpha-glucosidase
VEREAADPASMLSLYRRALALRRELPADERLEWIDTGRDDVLRFARPNGWQVITNFGDQPYSLEPYPEGEEADVVLTSTPHEGAVAPQSTVWIRG